MFQIDGTARIPVYEQIISQMEQFILTDILRAGDVVPSVRNVSQTHSINPRTVLKAYTDLDNRGLIQAVSGKGYFVCGDAKEKLLEEGRGELMTLYDMVQKLLLTGVTQEEIYACVKKAVEEGKA